MSAASLPKIVEATRIPVVLVGLVADVLGLAQCALRAFSLEPAALQFGDMFTMQGRVLVYLAASILAAWGNLELLRLAQARLNAVLLPNILALAFLLFVHLGLWYSIVSPGSVPVDTSEIPDQIIEGMLFYPVGASCIVWVVFWRHLYTYKLKYDFEDRSGILISVFLWPRKTVLKLLGIEFHPRAYLVTQLFVLYWWSGLLVSIWYLTIIPPVHVD